MENEPNGGNTLQKPDKHYLIQSESTYRKNIVGISREGTGDLLSGDNRRRRKDTKNTIGTGDLKYTDLKPTTIFNCFTKTTVKGFEPSFLSTVNATQIQLVNPEINWPLRELERVTATDRAGPGPSGFVELEELQPAVEEEIIGEELMSIRGKIEDNINLLKEQNFIEDGAVLDMVINPNKEHIDYNPDSLEVRILERFCPLDPTDKLDEEQKEVQEPEEPIIMNQ
ncbi:hypothetical protein DFP73DRAFT_601850 [Morchella snyderi]|nr:hypothetical protein DFP73DRAFT_601850 [Morchella snyderi]